MFFRQRKAKLYNGDVVREGNLVSFIDSDHIERVGRISRRPDKSLYFYNIDRDIKDYQNAKRIKVT